MTRHRHWVVDVAIRARDEALARDRAALGPLWPFAAVFRQTYDTLSAAFEALTPAFEQIGRAMTDAAAGLQPPQPPRHVGPGRLPAGQQRRPRLHR